MVLTAIMSIFWPFKILLKMSLRHLVLGHPRSLNPKYVHTWKRQYPRSMNFSSSKSSNTFVPPPPMLCRDFIHDKLYAPSKGYFSASDREVVHSLGDNVQECIPFRTLAHSWAYRRLLRELYGSETQAWLTPVEIFAPVYSHSLVRYILSHPRRLHKAPLRIFEIGGGSGANALHFLNYLREVAPETYRETEYTILEISPHLVARQEQRLYPHHEAQCSIVNADILNWNHMNSGRCFVLALEVLDNLPHDKVGLHDGLWTQYHVQEFAPGQFREHTAKLTDALIVETLQKFQLGLPILGTLPRSPRWNFWSPQRVATLDSAFIPTGAMQLLRVLKKYFPQHHLIASDFDRLPAPTFVRSQKAQVLGHSLAPTALSEGPLRAHNAPLVATKVTGTTVDQSTYLTRGYDCDIYFPTNFHQLARAYGAHLHRTSESISVVKNQEFMKAFAETDLTTTKSGYNPLLQDYSNTSFLLT